MTISITRKEKIHMLPCLLKCCPNDCVNYRGMKLLDTYTKEETDSDTILGTNMSRNVINLVQVELNATLNSIVKQMGDGIYSPLALLLLNVIVYNL